jgi:hypothetical protein
VDGINRYVRELAERGCINLDELPDDLGSELYKRKYLIAADVARQWFDRAEQSR